MGKAERKVVQYLGEAHAGEVGLVRGWGTRSRSHRVARIEIGWRGHLKETREHADRTPVLGRARRGRNPLQARASFRADEERMLERIMREVPKLTDAVVGAEIEGNALDDITKTGAAKVANVVKETARETRTRAKRAARQACKILGGAQVEGQIKGAVASEEGLAIARYGSLAAEEIVSKLQELSQIELATIASLQRRHDNRTTVVSRVNRSGPRRQRQPAREGCRCVRAGAQEARRRDQSRRPRDCQCLRSCPPVRGRRPNKSSVRALAPAFPLDDSARRRLGLI